MINMEKTDRHWTQSAYIVQLLTLLNPGAKPLLTVMLEVCRHFVHGFVPLFANGEHVIWFHVSVTERNQRSQPGAIGCVAYMMCISRAPPSILLSIKSS